MTKTHHRSEKRYKEAWQEDGLNICMCRLTSGYNGYFRVLFFAFRTFCAPATVASRVSGLLNNGRLWSNARKAQEEKPCVPTIASGDQEARQGPVDECQPTAFTARSGTCVYARGRGRAFSLPVVRDGWLGGDGVLDT